MDFQAQIETLREEWNRLTSEIAALPGGPVRLELKKRRNRLEAKANDIRTAWIADELSKPNPQHVPRVVFGEMRIRNPKTDGEDRGEDSWSN